MRPFSVTSMGPAPLPETVTMRASPKDPMEKFIGRQALPWGYLGSSCRAWVRKDHLLVEVDQIAGPRVVRIECEVRDGVVYLRPRRISTGSPGRELVSVDSCEAALPPDWPNRLYWLTEEYFHPIISPAYWTRGDRTPSERVRVMLTTESP
jgi:hypothetical protein